MAAPEGLIAALDQVIAFFNSRRMDLPDGLFDRKAQFTINGAPFETLLGATYKPDDPLILMLSRGPAGYRFTAKALQHALVDARIERGDVAAIGSSVSTQLWISGTLRDSGEAVNAVASITLRLNAAGAVEVAAATVDEPVLEKIRQARRS